MRGSATHKLMRWRGEMIFFSMRLSVSLKDMEAVVLLLECPLWEVWSLIN